MSALGPVHEAAVILILQGIRPAGLTSDEFRTMFTDDFKDPQFLTDLCAALTLYAADAFLLAGNGPEGASFILREAARKNGRPTNDHAKDTP